MPRAGVRLDRGGSCRGVVYRLAGRQVPDYFPALWDREMSTGAYLPRWLRCATEHGPVNALVFIMNRANPAYIRALPEPELLAIVRRASGRYGPCTEYVVQTARRCARPVSAMRAWSRSRASWRPTSIRWRIGPRPRGRGVGGTLTAFHPAGSATAMSVSDLRQSYEKGVLVEEQAAASPFQQFARWFDEAVAPGCPNPTP